jgi:DNA-binding transcriptional LysR family regulator
MMNWDDLKFLLLLEEKGSLAAAARRLGVDHVTVARRIASLEDALGVKLVDRRQKRTIMTQAGLRIAAHARRMQEEVHALERTASSVRPEVAGPVSISAPGQITAELIAPRLGPFLKAYPGLEITLRGDVQTVSLTRREADVSVRLSTPADPTLIRRQVGTLRYRFLASPAYVAETVFAAYRYVLFDDGDDLLPHEKWMEMLAARPFAIAMRSNDLGIQLAAVAAGTGVLAAPEILGSRHGLVDAHPEKAFFDRNVWLCWHEDQRGQPAIEAIVAFLADCFRSQSGS